MFVEQPGYTGSVKYIMEGRLQAKGLNCDLKTTRTNYEQTKFSRRSSNQFRNSTLRTVAESKPKYKHTESFSNPKADKPAKAEESLDAGS